ncbi:MAG TPA: FAD-dependent oxidoreductase [Actinomycetes bacterium]
MLRVAVVGSGPAGVYTAEALLRYGGEVLLDVIDGLPAPFGLVRYGVAPDHPRTQSISATLAAVLQQPSVRFLGNVHIGSDLKLEEMRDHYDAVVVATGAAVDRHLDVPGEDLPGSVSATDLVAWYCGHPDTPPDLFRLDARSVAVVGAGNVAGDVARMLASSPEELRATDVADHVLAAFSASTVEDVHLIARRGPAQAKFTTRELRELGDLAEADVLVDPADLELDDVSRELLTSNAGARRNVDVLRGWAETPPAGRPRRVHLHFFAKPIALTGDGRVEGIQLERTAFGPDGSLKGTGEQRELPVQLVVRAVGYRSLPLPGLPFDAEAGVVPHKDGRVCLDGAPVPGAYVAGWAKRGPTGVIGTNKHDARETVRSLLEDVPSLTPAPQRDPDTILRLLAERGVQVVDWAGWAAVDAAELERGRAQGRPRIKITDRAELLRLSRQ